MATYERDMVGGTNYRNGISRMINGYTRAVENNELDTPALEDLVRIQADLDQAQARIVLTLRGNGYSWTQIANALGMSSGASAYKKFVVRGGMIDPETALKPGQQLDRI